jgi:exonuclease V
MVVLLWRRSYFAKFGNDSAAVRSILRKFVRDGGDEPGLADLLPNQPLQKLYSNWHLNESYPLPLLSPISRTPFQFHSTFNVDQSYITSPRLSVTKLLTGRWCELREYYTIYSESEAINTAAMTSGVSFHLGLELQLHVPTDTTELITTLEHITSGRIEEIRSCVDLISDPELHGVETARLDKFEDGCFGSIKESNLAMDWTDLILSRIFSLFTTSEAREVLIHGYVDIQNGSFNATTDKFDFNIKPSKIVPSTNVLVSGVIDYLKLVNPTCPTDLSLFQDINDFIEYEFRTTINGSRIIDLSKFLQDVPYLLKDSGFEIVTTDVKTRSFNRIPAQSSVLKAAKFQTFYYRKFLELLSQKEQSVDFAYSCLLENASNRGIDVDKPINYTTIVNLLRKFPNLLYRDFIKLANGEPIGFAPYDTFVEQSNFDDYRIQEFLVNYESDDSLSSLDNKPTQKIVHQLNSIDSFDYGKLLTSDLLKPWKTPPTLRYFAARGAQFYQLCAGIVGDETTVEYHNSKTGRCFHINTYKYSEDELDAQLNQACTFWNGSRDPEYVSDLNKCKYCAFNSKCLIPNHQAPEDFQKKQIGSKIYGFLSLVD